MYFFYLDESGTSSLTPKSIRESPFFVLGALGLHESSLRDVDNYLTKLKRAYFPSIDPRQVEFKSRIIRKAMAKAETPKSPWPSLSKENIRTLIDELYGLFEKVSFTMIFVAIDKKRLWQKYTNPYPPYSVAYALVWQQVARFLGGLSQSERGIFVVDEHHEAEKRLEQYQTIANDLNLQSPRPVDLDAVVERPFFVNSKNFQVIQLADLCVYNAWRAVSSNDYNYEYFRRIEPYIFKPSPLYSWHGVIIYPAFLTQRDLLFGVKKPP